MKNFYKLFFATILIYYGSGMIENLTEASSDTPCMKYDCPVVSCPEGYAIYIPEEKKFLPCDMWDQYVNIGNKSVLR